VSAGGYLLVELYDPHAAMDPGHSPGFHFWELPYCATRQLAFALLKGGKLVLR
jgi:hypothetical protein